MKVVWAGRAGIVDGLADLFGALAFGAFCSSVLFDLNSLRAGSQFLYARGAYTLLLIGLVAGAVAAVLGAAQVARLDRRSPAFRSGLVRLAGVDLGLVWFALSYLSRRDSPLSVVSTGTIVVSAGVVGLVGIVRWLAPAPAPGAEAADPTSGADPP